LNDLDDVVASISVEASKFEELAHLFDDGTVVDGPGYGHASAAPKFEEAFIAKDAQGTEHRVGVHGEHSRKVLRWR
jgi:hypothetical protein